MKTNYELSNMFMKAFFTKKLSHINYLLLITNHLFIFIVQKSLINFYFFHIYFLNIIIIYLKFKSISVMMVGEERNSLDGRIVNISGKKEKLWMNWKLKNMSLICDTVITRKQFYKELHIGCLSCSLDFLKL